MAGTQEIREFLLNFRFTRDDIKFLKEVPALRSLMLRTNFSTFLEDFTFTGDLWAMAEGEIAFAGEPLVRISGTLPEVHLAETFILSVLNHDIKVASKAARIVLAARGRPVLEFGTRRTHHEAAVYAARAAYLAEFAATSNIEAGARFGIPLKGTMSHMWVMSHNSEEEAFNNFNGAYRNPILLVDTYDTLNGTRLAAKIKSLGGIRLDSGDLGDLSRETRKILDESGHKSAKIIVSNDLNEYSIDELCRSGAPIDCFAVGTELVVSRDVPSLGAVYKVVYDDTNDRPLIKIAPGKTTLPGRKQVFLDQRNGEWVHLVAVDGEVQPSEELVPLLDCHIENGKSRVDNLISKHVLDVARKYCNAALISLPSHIASLDLEPDLTVPVVVHDSVQQMFQKAAVENE
jgi:nicotinate phosphoribosyltransferase